jgi:hypothetical protein
MATFLARLILRSGGQLPQNPPDRFPDDNGSVHEPNINALAAAGIVSGRADGTYGPFDLVSRGQMATFLVRADEYRSGKTLTATADWFPDDIHSPHQDNINKAASAGVVAGLATGIYRPDGAVARDQMASFLARELDLVVEQTGTKPPSG